MLANDLQEPPQLTIRPCCSKGRQARRLAVAFHLILTIDSYRQTSKHEQIHSLFGQLAHKLWP